MKALQFTATLSSIFASLTCATVTHSSSSKNLRIHRGQFSHFRLIGEGINDANLAADLSSTDFSLNIKSVNWGEQFGTPTYNPFDLYIFNGGDSANSAYECFVDKSNSYFRHGVLETCPFMTDGYADDWVKSQVFEYSLDKSSLLNSQVLHQDFFLVIDNSGWFSAVQNLEPDSSSSDDSNSEADDQSAPSDSNSTMPEGQSQKREDLPPVIGQNTTNPNSKPQSLKQFQGLKLKAETASTNDVIVDINLQTEYNDNDVFNFLFLGSMTVIGAMLFLLFVLLIAYKCSRNTYNKLVEQQMEYKQDQLMRNGYVEEQDVAINADDD